MYLPYVFNFSFANKVCAFCFSQSTHVSLDNWNFVFTHEATHNLNYARKILKRLL